MGMERGELERRELARALANGGAAAVRRVRYGLYQVRSATRPGQQHTVSVAGRGHWRCSCEAGQAGRPCWHAGAVYVAKVEAGGGRVTGPAVRLAPAAAPQLPANVTPLRRAA